MRISSYTVVLLTLYNVQCALWSVFHLLQESVLNGRLEPCGFVEVHVYTVEKKTTQISICIYNVFF